nr:transglutaminase-like domain-containing protein [uncultured Sphingosinicella sp.]
MIQSITHLGLLDDETIALDDAALDLAALDHPGIDLAPYRERLDQLSLEIAATGAGARTAPAQAELLSRVLFEEHGFRGDSIDYDDPANADFIAVLDRRRGIPVSLSILYVAMARRTGWSAHALNTPGHVLVRIGTETDPALVDPFNGGPIVDADGLTELLSGVFGTQVTPSAEHLQPMRNRAVLVRLLTNQASRALQAGNAERALILYGRMTVVAPSFGHLWWERARLELTLGDKSAARGSLSAMLEMTRDPVLRTHISAALDALASS